LSTSEVDVSGGEVVDALVVSLMIVMIDERFNLCFQVCREEVVLQQDAVLQGLVPSLDLALCLRMIWRTSDMSHFLIIQPFDQLNPRLLEYQRVKPLQVNC
jgi:hypothetical protein